LNVDTSKARAAILARIRSAQGRAGPPSAQERQAVEDYVAHPPRGPGITLGADTVAHFEAQAQRMASTTQRVARLADVPAAVARYLVAHGLPLRAVCWRTLAGLDWPAAGLAVEARAPRDGDPVGITGVFAGIAETGTLMMLSGPDTPASTHLLPETHVAVVPASRVVGHYEDAFARVRAERGQPPRAMSLVSGPSRTGDIEQTIVLGAHGPYRVHVVIVEQD
jgi:L-lactate dehydrogenase complex protein LldG